MKKLLIVIAALVVLLGVVAAIGAILPSSHVASRSAEFAATPDQVWAAINDVEAFPAWRPGVKQVMVVSVAPVTWTETDRYGDGITFAIVSSDRPRRLVTRIADTNLPFGGEWQYDLSPSGGRTRLTITERGEIHNVFYRFISRFLIGYHRTIDQYLAALPQRLAPR